MNCRNLTYFLVLLCFLLYKNAFPQGKSTVADPKEVKEKFEMGNYQDALKGYLSLVKKDPGNDEYNYKIGICYLSTNIDKSKAIPYLELLAKKDNKEALFYLGLAYHQASRFDDAIKTFEKLKSTGKGDEKTKKLIDQQMQYCMNAKELIKFPLNVKFENLGKEVNSPFPDYMPYVPADESFIAFNSKRKALGAIKDEEGNGSYPAGIFISKIDGEDFATAKNIGSPINDKTGDQEIVGMSNSGAIILFWKSDNEMGSTGVFQSEADKNKNFKKALELDKSITQGQEIFGFITDDGNTLYFSSTRNGGYGGSDLWFSHKLPDGSWGIPMNLGNEINTEMDENHPNISSDGKMLYFSSNGHVSMGGFDIFKAEWDEQSKTWTKVKNIGYPINTPADENTFRIAESGRYGYLSALRPEGLGDLDIYKVIFKKVDPKYTVVRGSISSADTLRKIAYADLVISVNNTKTNEFYGSYLANSNTGNYIVIIPPGSFSLSFELEGFKTVTDTIIVSEKTNRTTEIKKDFVLKPKAK